MIRMRRMLCLGAGLAVLLAGAGSHAADPSSLESLTLDTRVSILDSRAWLTVPARTESVPLQASIMAVPASNAQQTRLVIDAGAARMVVMAWELLALAGDDLAAAVRASLGASAAEREIAQLALATEEIRAVRARPVEPVLQGDAALVDTAYVELTDGTVIYLAAYVNAAGLEDLAGSRVLAGKLLGSIAPGDRRLPRDAGPRKLGDLQVTTPAGYVSVTQQGPDFLFHSVYELVELGTPQPMLGIYVGFQPALQSDRDADPSALRITREPGRLFGRDITWLLWEREGVRTIEVIEPIESGSSGPYAHVFASSPNADDLAELRKIAETLTAAPAVSQ